MTIIIKNNKNNNDYFFIMPKIEKIQETLGNHGYEFKKIIGSGSSSQIMLCNCKKYGQDFAIKRTSKYRITESEYATIKSLDHPNIIKLYDAFEDESAQYLVMEYCSNGTLKDKKRISEEKFINYAKQIISAVSYCHSKNIAHRDIKPDNIFIDQYDKIKLADFGLAKKLDTYEESDKLYGSMRCFSPEKLSSPSFCPFKADVWSLGITLFYMITGYFPYDAKYPEELKHYIIYDYIDFAALDIHPKIKFIISKAVTKNPKQRPTAEELLKISLFSSKNDFQKKVPKNLYNPQIYSSPKINNNEKVEKKENTDISHSNTKSFRFINNIRQPLRIKNRSAVIVN